MIRPISWCCSHHDRPTSWWKQPIMIGEYHDVEQHHDVGLCIMMYVHHDVYAHHDTEPYHDRSTSWSWKASWCVYLYHDVCASWQCCTSWYESASWCLFIMSVMCIMMSFVHHDHTISWCSITSWCGYCIMMHRHHDVSEHQDVDFASWWDSIMLFRYIMMLWVHRDVCASW